MAQTGSKKLKIGWIVPTVGIFGAVREMVEVSNELVTRGHTVYIYHPDGTPCKWLKCLAETRKLQTVAAQRLDVLIGIVDWQSELYNDLLSARSSYKAICLLGFEPTEAMAQSLRGEIKAQDAAQRIIRDAMQRGFGLLTDSSWQIRWVEKATGYAAGPAFGGINTAMFFAPEKPPSNTPLKIAYSGDPRPRKGSDTVIDALKILERDRSLSFTADAYWGKRFDQPDLVKFIQDSDIFLDGHRRAGWCNPVAEAMACGSVPVCTDIGANSDFALPDQTALVVPVDNALAMAAAAKNLLQNAQLRQTLRQNGIRHIKNFSYATVVDGLEKFFLDKT